MPGSADRPLPLARACVVVGIALLLPGLWTAWLHGEGGELGPALGGLPGSLRLPARATFLFGHGAILAAAVFLADGLPAARPFGLLAAGLAILLAAAALVAGIVLAAEGIDGGRRLGPGFPLFCPGVALLVVGLLGRGRADLAPP